MGGRERESRISTENVKQYNYHVTYGNTWLNADVITDKVLMRFYCFGKSFIFLLFSRGDYLELVKINVERDNMLTLL